MRASLFTLITATATGAFTAFLLHVGLPSSRSESRWVTPATPGAEVGHTGAARSASPSIAESAPLTLGERMDLAYYQWTGQEAPMAPLHGSTTRLLNEPVAILQQSGQGWKELPKGTAVEVVATKGSFSQLRYAQKLVTVPSKVLVAGVSRTN